MRLEIKTYPTNENVSHLIKHSRIVEPEWETIIRCAYEAGVKTSIARHLGQSHLSGNEIMLRHALSLGPSWRELPAELHTYLLRLTGASAHFCPRLHAMGTVQFANAWRDLCTAAGVKIQMIILTWPYQDAHCAELKWERARSYLDKLANDWLVKEEIEDLKSNSQRWMRMGSKDGNRRRRLTRAQILAPLGQEVTNER